MLTQPGRSRGIDLGPAGCSSRQRARAQVQELAAYLGQGKGMVKRGYERTEARKRVS